MIWTWISKSLQVIKVHKEDSKERMVWKGKQNFWGSKCTSRRRGKGLWVWCMRMNHMMAVQCAEVEDISAEDLPSVYRAHSTKLQSADHGHNFLLRQLTSRNSGESRWFPNPILLSRAAQKDPSMSNTRRWWCVSLWNWLLKIGEEVSSINIYSYTRDNVI